tara:strand:+ start:22 stop:540 length:519 start_codon:yes stop_codon:yes gene_type:complete
MELSKKRTGLEAKFFDLSQKIVSECGYEIYDLDYITGSSTLRVFIMDPKTNSALIDDCIKVDRAFNPYCETEDWIPDDFVLEVSSPGVYRSLKTLTHFEMAKGQIVTCSITGDLSDEQKNQLNNKKLSSSKKFRGELKEVNNEYFEIELNGLSLKLAFDQVKKANLDPDFAG